MNKMEEKFNEAMWDIYHSAKKKCNYNATLFMQMLAEYGGVDTAKKLLSKEKTQYGFTELWLCGRLDLTVEAHVVMNEFKELFAPEEIKRAKDRLLAHDTDYFKKF